MVVASFYDDVLRELVVAFGAALFFGYGWALVKRRRDAEKRAAVAGARSGKVKGASRAAATGRTLDGELVQAPIGRSVAFMLLGLVMLIAGIASLTA